MSETVIRKGRGVLANAPWSDSAKGYGFIELDDAEEGQTTVFIPPSVVVAEGLSYDQVGEKVLVVYASEPHVSGKRSLVARSVTCPPPVSAGATDDAEVVDAFAKVADCAAAVEDALQSLEVVLRSKGFDV